MGDSAKCRKDISADIFLFKHKQAAFIYDVNSNSLHLLDGLAYQVLAALLDANGDWEAAREKLNQSAVNSNEVDEVLSELKELQQAGTLLTTDALGQQLAKGDAMPRLGGAENGLVVKALCLHVAHDCNLRCQYCFAGTGPFGGDRSLLSLETGKAAIDFLLINSPGRKHVEVDFFGGEPLLNFKVVRELVSYGRAEAEARGKKLKFTLTTNGLLLNQKVQEFLNQEGLSTVLSLDGRQEVHDRMRPYIDGSGSYEDVVQNLQRFVQSRNGQDYYVRGTYTYYNQDFAQDVLHIHDLGFENLSVEPVVAPPGEAYALREDSLAKLDEQYAQLAEEVYRRRKAGRDFNFFHFNLDLAHGPCLTKRLSGCGAGHEYLAVSPDGGLWPCHQFVGREEYRVGNVLTGQLNRDVAERFRGAHIYAKEDCPDCWARFLCSGGCHANNEMAGELHSPNRAICQLTRLRLKWALYLKALEAMEQVRE